MPICEFSASKLRKKNKFSKFWRKKISASKSRKIDVHAHVLPKNIPDFQKVFIDFLNFFSNWDSFLLIYWFFQKFGYPGFVRLDHKKDGTTNMMKDGKLFRLIAKFLFILLIFWFLELLSQIVLILRQELLIWIERMWMFSVWARFQWCLAIGYVYHWLSREPDKMVGSCQLQKCSFWNLLQLCSWTLFCISPSFWVTTLQNPVLF